MPKRVATPPPGDDEPRYLTVVHPYAIDGTCNMELPKDRQDFARWVACCIGEQALFAIFHKPSSRGMVIIEVNRDYPYFERILGEHRWCDFLRNPTEEEKARVTQVFYCTYHTGRIVQKNGWKRIDVEESWFKAWSPNNKIITYPYPSTHFCDVPVEDQTNLAMCRPLPGAVKVTPVEVIAAPQPVVGSAAWIQSKDAPSRASATQQSKPKSAWDKGAPKVHATSARPNPTANGSAKKSVGIPQGFDTGAKTPAIGGGSISVKSSNVWKNTAKKPTPTPTPVMTNWDQSSPVSPASTPGPLSRAVSPATSQLASAAPPGLMARKNAWESGAPTSLVVPNKVSAPDAPDRASNSSASCWDSTGNSTSSPDSESGPDLTTATESDNPYTVHIHFSESMEEEFHGMRIRAMEDDDLGELDAIAPGSWDDPINDTWETTNGPSWDNSNDALDAEDQWRQNQAPATQMLCKAHGVVCKKGICAEYAKQVRLAKRAEEAENRKAALANKGNKKGARAKNRGGAGKNKDEDQDQPFARRGTVNNAFRGPGAPVKTNWRGAPRAIVSADAIEKRETAKAASEDGWGHSTLEIEPNADAVVTPGDGDLASNASWGISENAYDPWAAPVSKVNNGPAAGNTGKSLGKKKPAQTQAVSSSWADQVDAELPTGNDGDGFSAVSSKRGSKKRGGSSTTGWGTSTAKSSASGWGSAAHADMPW